MTLSSALIILPMASTAQKVTGKEKTTLPANWVNAGWD